MVVFVLFSKQTFLSYRKETAFRFLDEEYRYLWDMNIYKSTNKVAQEEKRISNYLSLFSHVCKACHSFSRKDRLIYVQGFFFCIQTRRKSAWYKNKRMSCTTAASLPKISSLSFRCFRYIFSFWIDVGNCEICLICVPSLYCHRGLYFFIT